MNTQLTRKLAKVLVLLTVLALALPFTARAQQAESEGVNQGNYNIKQSFEFGGRITSFTGNNATYRTWVNLQDGPRLLEHNLQMRSLNHQGWLFDDFSLSSFGYGGDPNAVTRLRMYKNKWYNFTGTFRLDRNQWDYSLLANPLNPATSNPAFPITYSPHKMETVRRMSDFNLTLLPQSNLRFRLGYTRNINEGPSFSTFHEGTDIGVLQDWKTTLNTYSFGVDFRGLPKTNISYDQFFQYYKGDTTWLDIPGVRPLDIPRYLSQIVQGANTLPFDLGIIFDTVAGTSSPCRPVISNPATSPPTAFPTCNGYLFYGRAGNVRTSYPTEQLSFQTNYFEKLDLSGRIAYSSSKNDVLGYNEGAYGRVSRTSQMIFALDGPSNGKRISTTVDFGATFHIKDNFRIVDSFHFTHFRVPGFFDLSECSLFGSTLAGQPTQFSGQTTVPANCAALVSAFSLTPTVGNAAHSSPTATSNSSSPADVINEVFSTFIGQDTKQNTFQVLYDFTKRYSGRLGYRWGRRTITEFIGEGSLLVFFPASAVRGACALPTTGGANPVGTFNPACTTTNPANPQLGVNTFTQDLEFEDPNREEINEHSLLLGISARPVDQVRITFDSELFWADRSFVRIGPRRLQRYKIRTTYQPKPWASFNLNINLVQWRNPVVLIDHRQYTRMVGLGMALEPNDRWGFDFGYDYEENFSHTNICYALSGTPTGATVCPISGSPSPISGLSHYKAKNHFGYFDTMWKPFKRLTTRLGYSLVNVDGSATYPGSELPDATRPPAPPSGTLRYIFHRPYAGFDLDLARGFTWRTGWNYYGYNEKARPDVFSAPRDSSGNLIGRDFRGNTLTLSIRYGF